MGTGMSVPATSGRTKQRIPEDPIPLDRAGPRLPGQGGRIFPRFPKQWEWCPWRVRLGGAANPRPCRGRSREFWEFREDFREKKKKDKFPAAARGGHRPQREERLCWPREKKKPIKNREKQSQRIPSAWSGNGSSREFGKGSRAPSPLSRRVFQARPVPSGRVRSS